MGSPIILWIAHLKNNRWDIDLSEFISQFDFEEGIENLRPLIEYNSDGEINENLLSAVTQAICKRTEEIKRIYG